MEQNGQGAGPLHVIIRRSAYGALGSSRRCRSRVRPGGVTRFSHAIGLTSWLGREMEQNARARRLAGAITMLEKKEKLYP